jgi:catechol 2,3-dioxygenase-like lactoylglutathione lyase family enzyme
MTSAPQALGGLHEACFGVLDLESAAAYWAAFGFRPDARGRLDATRAAELYGVATALESVRLRHLDSDHGLVRLMRWERPLGAGIGLAPLRAHGGRWVAQFVRSALDVANHGAAARRAGWPLLDVPPSYIDLSSYNPQLFGARGPRAFADRLIAVREYTLIQPLWRQAFLERFHYDSPLLGRIDDDALLRASQIVNASLMITSDDPQVFGFYEHVLGLRAAPVQEVPWAQAMASRGVFDLREGETHWCYTFEEPRSGATADARRSGRLYLFRFPTSAHLPDRLAVSQPGHLGCTLYTWRVRDLAAFREASRAAGSRDITEPVADEFGVTAIRCLTPDGMTWVFQQASEAERASLAA